MRTPALEHEDGIGWTDDVERFDYVRQSVELSASTRRRPVPWSGTGRGVGYAMFRPDAPAGDVQASSSGESSGPRPTTGPSSRTEHTSAQHPTKRSTLERPPQVFGVNSPNGRGERPSLRCRSRAVCLSALGGRGVDD